MNIREIIGREFPLFAADISASEGQLTEIVQQSRFLVIGGAGSIGQAVAIEIFRRNPRVLHVVDISENNLVELVREIRSSMGYGTGEFATFALDCGSREFEALVRSSGAYDYVFNLSALKHVRSEKDPFTLMRMLDVNIFNTIKTMNLAKEAGSRHYFCVSTDKAENPVNLMGASKRIMELILMQQSDAAPFSTARLANVAFSDGSLLHGFNQRFIRQQPITAPSDVSRFFLTPREAGELCLIAGLLGKNKELFLPRLAAESDLVDFKTIAERYCIQRGYEPWVCNSEDEARQSAADLIAKGRWPCYFFASDTTGEKEAEVLYAADALPDYSRFKNIGVLSSEAACDSSVIEDFVAEVSEIRSSVTWTKRQLVEAVQRVLPEFSHMETGKYLDGRM